MDWIDPATTHALIHESRDCVPETKRSKREAGSTKGRNVYPFRSNTESSSRVRYAMPRYATLRCMAPRLLEASWELHGTRPKKL